MSVIRPRGEWEIEREERVEVLCRPLMAWSGERIDVACCEYPFHRRSERSLSLRALRHC
jgi:hypothetical protein